ncbi:hypothetical protein Tco_0895588 [Tanacetum coccineum]|uniref:Uncharacterized protein n=1 Tax=Tanacetum coccineum TaxID=301880 RepID=A0ABQ5CIF8_9ASTR
MFTKQSILGKPPSSCYKPKLYSVTPFPKSLVLPKVDKKNALSKPVTSNSAPSTRESKVVQTVNVIAPRIFMPNPFKTSRVDNVVPNKPVKTSVGIKPITVSQPNVIHKQQANSDSNGFSSTRVNNTAKTRRPHPRSNSNTDRVPSKSKITANHDVCVLNYINDMNSRADNQSANVSIRKNQKKHKANAKKLKELGSKGSLASSRPSKPRTCLRWIPTRRIFAMCGKLTASSNTKNKSEKSVCDNAGTSIPSEPSSKGFSNSASLLGSQNRRDLPRNTPLDRVEVLGMIEKRSKVRKGIVPTEMELVLEQTQQGTSHEVSESRFRRFLDNQLEEEERMWYSIQHGPYQRPSVTNPNNPQEQIPEPLSKMTKGDKKKYIADVRFMNYILQAIPNDIYNSVDACATAKEMWEQIKRLMHGSDINAIVRHSQLMDEFDKFTAKEGE